MENHLLSSSSYDNELKGGEEEWKKERSKVRDAKEGGDLISSEYNISASSSSSPPPPPPALNRFFSAPVGAFIHLSSGSSLRGTILNLINTVVGGGILALPRAFESLGLIPGIVMFLVVILCTDISIYYILYCIDSLNVRTFADIARHLYGNKMKIIVDINTFLLSFGICTSYVVIVGSLFNDFFKYVTPDNHILTNRNVIVLIVSSCLFLPLSILKKLDSLRYVSFCCLTFLTCFSVVVLLLAVGADSDVHVKPDGGKMKIAGHNPLKILESLPVILFAFVCHMNVPTLYDELRRMSPKTVQSPKPMSKYKLKRNKMRFAGRVALCTCGVLYVVSGIGGYATFGSQLEDNVLENFKREFGGMLRASPVVKLVYGLLLTFSFPTLCYSAIRSMHRLLFELYTHQNKESTLRLALACLFRNEDGSSSSESSREGKDAEAPYVALSEGIEEALPSPGDRESLASPQVVVPDATLLVRVVEAAFIISLASMIGITCNSITTVFSLTGSVTCSAIMLVFPGLFYYRLRTREGAETSSSDMWIAWFIGRGGILIGVVCTTVVVYNIITGK